MAETHPTVAPTTTLAEALPLFDRCGAVCLAVMACDGPDDPPRLIGSVHHIDVLRALNQALEQTAAEEHG
nr:CBS domain-containing protein [Paracoccus gahaiensis]